MAKSVQRWTNFFNEEIAESFNHMSAKTILRKTDLTTRPANVQFVNSDLLISDS